MFQKEVQGSCLETNEGPHRARRQGKAHKDAYCHLNLGFSLRAWEKQVMALS